MNHDPECPQGSRFTKLGPSMCVCHIIASKRAETNGIMTHDPLCPRWMTTMNGDTWHPFENSGTCLLCDLIAKVRADEREKARHDFQTACIDIELLIQTLIGVNERLGGSGGISDIL